MRVRTLALATCESGPRAVLVTLRAKRRGAKQKLREFARLSRLVAATSPSVVVEIGTMHGGTLWTWCQLAADDALVVSIDLPGGAFGGGYEAACAETLRSYARPSQRLELIAGDSHDPTTLERLTDVLAGRKIDFLFIDGDHTYEGVSQDFATYGPLLAAQGVIAFHDILPCRPEDGDVNRLWEQLKTIHRHEEFVDASDISWRGAWGGIGVLFNE